jgi:hypothetical protein
VANCRNCQTDHASQSISLRVISLRVQAPRAVPPLAVSGGPMVSSQAVFGWAEYVALRIIEVQSFAACRKGVTYRLASDFPSSPRRVASRAKKLPPGPSSKAPHRPAFVQESSLDIHLMELEVVHGG